jgi:signal transduction histidine kinase
LRERIAGFRGQVRAFAHDIRNPINVILGFERIIASELAGPINDEQRKQLAMMEEAAESLLRIAESAAALASSGEPVQVGEMKVVDVGDLVARVAERFRPLAVGRGLALTAHTNSNLHMRTDPALLERIVENLTSNAIKYTREGTVAVRASRGRRDTIVIEVADTGVGVCAEDKAHLFEEGFRAAATAEEVEGLGLGLALVKEYANALGGSVSCESELGAGSVFTVTLPAGSSAD